MCTIDFLVHRGVLYVKASKNVINGYHIGSSDVVLFNNVRHVPFIPTMRTRSDVHKLRGASADLEGRISEF